MCCQSSSPRNDSLFLLAVRGSSGERRHWIGTGPTTTCHLSHSASSHHVLSSWLVLPHWVLIHRRHSNWTISFTASFASSRSLSLHHTRTNFSCPDSDLLHHLELSSPAPSHLSSPTLYPTHHLSTTPSNTLLTLRHPHSHQANLIQSSHIMHPSLTISHHPTAWFHFQTTNLQTSASTSLHSTPQSPHLHFTITASNQMHIYIRSNAPHHTHPT